MNWANQWSFRAYIEVRAVHVLGEKQLHVTQQDHRKDNMDERIMNCSWGLPIENLLHNSFRKIRKYITN